MDKCSQVNLSSLNYSDCYPHNFGNDIDPNNNFYKSNFHKSKDYILELNVKFDISTITETWIEPNLISDFIIYNYDAFHITRGTRRGVVLLYT